MSEKSLFPYINKGYTDLMYADYSKNWRKLRKMTQTGLNMLHDGSGDIKSKIIRECKALRGRLLSTQSRAIAVREELGNSSVFFVKNYLIRTKSILSQTMKEASLNY